LQALDSEYEYWKDPTIFDDESTYENWKFVFENYTYLNFDQNREVEVTISRDTSNKKCFDITIRIPFQDSISLKMGVKKILSRFEEKGGEIVQENSISNKEYLTKVKMYSIKLNKKGFLGMMEMESDLDALFNNILSITYEPCSKVNK